MDFDRIHADEWTLNSNFDPAARKKERRRKEAQCGETGSFTGRYLVQYSCLVVEEVLRSVLLIQKYFMKSTFQCPVGQEICILGV